MQNENLPILNVYWDTIPEHIRIRLSEKASLSVNLLPELFYNLFCELAINEAMWENLIYEFSFALQSANFRTITNLQHCSYIEISFKEKVIKDHCGLVVFCLFFDSSSQMINHEIFYFVADDKYIDFEWVNITQLEENEEDIIILNF